MDFKSFLGWLVLLTSALIGKIAYHDYENEMKVSTVTCDKRV